jgi:uncharacterized cupredoxin-like copper-binding protein
VRRPTGLVIALLAGALVLTACGDDDDDSGDAQPDATIPAGAVTVNAADIDFPTKEFTATAGTVTFVYVNNPGVIQHSLEIEGVPKGDFYLEINGAGDQDVGTAELAAGTYTIFCDIPGHRQAGMEGTVTVS